MVKGTLLHWLCTERAEVRVRAESQARDHFQMGSAEEGHVQAEALAWLGVWEAEEGANPASARELFQAALELDPQDPTAGATSSPSPTRHTSNPPPISTPWVRNHSSARARPARLVSSHRAVTCAPCPCKDRMVIALQAGKGVRPRCAAAEVPKRFPGLCQL